eukprot:2341908-Prymnesium_polylepis.1
MQWPALARTAARSHARRPCVESSRPRRPSLCDCDPSLRSPRQSSSWHRQQQAPELPRNQKDPQVQANADEGGASSR